MPDRRNDEAVIAEALDRGARALHALHYEPKQDAALAALASLSLRLQNAETALAAAEEVVARRVKWAPEPGTLPFALATSIDKLAAALASSAEREPEHAEAVEKAQAFVRGEVQGKCCAEWPECSHVFEAVTGEPWAEREPESETA